MQAARVHKPGPPEVIVVESIDGPEPGQQEILVRVRAAGVGPWDIPVGSVLPLEDAIAAHEMLAGTRPHKRSKIVLEIIG